MVAQQPRDVGTMRKRWNTNSVLIGIGMDIWDQLSDDDSFLFRLRIGASLDEGDQVTKFSVHKDGTVTATAFVGDGSGLTNLPGGGGGGTIVNDAFGIGWDGDTTQGASRNVLYDQFIVVAGTVTAEAATRAAADTALDVRLDAIEADYATDTELNAAVGVLNAVDTSLDGRLDAIEADYTTSVELAAAISALNVSQYIDAAELTTALAAYVTTSTYNTFVSLVDQTNIAYKNAANTFTASQTLRSIVVAADSTYDIATNAVRYANGYFDNLPGVNIVDGTANTQPTGTSDTKIATGEFVVETLGEVLLDYLPLNDLETAAFSSSWNGSLKLTTKNTIYDAIAPGSLDFGAVTGANTTVYRTVHAPYPFTIDSIQNVRTTSGTITLAVKINGTNVTGLSAVNITSTPQDINATAANAVAIGDEVTLVFSSNASAVDIRGTLLITKTG